MRIAGLFDVHPTGRKRLANSLIDTSWPRRARGRLYADCSIRIGAVVIAVDDLLITLVLEDPNQQGVVPGAHGVKPSPVLVMPGYRVRW